MSASPAHAFCYAVRGYKENSRPSCRDKRTIQPAGTKGAHTLQAISDHAETANQRNIDSLSGPYSS